VISSKKANSWKIGRADEDKELEEGKELEGGQELEEGKEF
jgi:hypothetical protein